MIKNSQKYPLFSMLVISLSFLLSACSLKPVSQNTLNASKSYSDFKGVKVVVGQQAPLFSLPDAQGNAVSLQQYKSKQPVMLLFYRGDWCPFCVDQLEDYQSLLPELEKYNIQLIAISPDARASIENTQRKFGRSYLFLSDQDLQITRKYGIGNKKDLPHPAIFLIDKEGTLVWYYASKDHKARPSAVQVEKIIQKSFVE